MTDGLAPTPREHGWTRMVLALAAFLLLPAVPKLRAAPILAELCAVLPVSDTVVLLLPALAACFVAGWWAGGRFWAAVAWVALAALALAPPGFVSMSAYSDLVRGWALVVAGAFGVVCVVSPGQRFFGRAMTAAGIASLIVIGVVAASGLHAGNAQGAFADHFARENQLSDAALEAVATRMPWLRTVWLAPTAVILPRLSQAAGELYPALLALEALVACAIAWALYHRLSRWRLGAPLARLRDFRFNDQFIWALVAAVTMLFFSSLGALRPLGYNLAVFFGALYALRGLGVMAWFVARWERPATAIIFAAVAVLLGWITLGLAFAIGVGDTWANWRNRPPRATLPGRAGPLL
ncbi:MAG: DUF2232 domain-containing protein [Gemmatimonadaceae bacterium]